MKIQRVIKIRRLVQALVLTIVGGCWAALGSQPVAPAQAAGQAASQNNQDREFHQVYNITPKGTVGIYNSSGVIRVTTWDENRVKVDAVKRGRRQEDFAHVQIEVTAKPESVEIRAVYQKDKGEMNRRGNSVSVDFDVKVPRGVALSPANTSSGDVNVTGPIDRVTVRVSSGNITVTDVTDTASLTASSGNIHAARVSGELRVNASSGNLTINDIGSRLIAQTSSGAIHASQVRDDATAIVSSGDIKLEKIGGRAVARASSGAVWVNDVGGDVQADSVTDDVTVTNVRGYVRANATSGSLIIRNASEGVRGRAISSPITISDCKGAIDAGSVSGSITLTNIDSHEVVAKSTSGDIRFTGKLQDGGRYEFESFSSGVVLILPPDSQFNLTAKTHGGSINTEFPVQLTRTTGGSLMSGTVGKGGAELRVASFSGSVQIKKDVGKTR
ncbi:MAG: DUF4097 domain-containing protein [Acidobacteriota bacterium]|nr:DUF4097 domain-containing protein [Acidobacteriota bacterium]